MKKYLFPFALALALASCNETIPVGSDVLPGSDHPDNFFTDTITLVTRTVREDSLRTDKLFLSQLGYAEDPVFGATTASMVIGFHTPAFGLNADLLDTVGGYFLDSVVLALAVDGIYGDTNQRMSLTAYKLAQPLSAEEIYYSTTRVPQGLTVAGRKENFYPPLRKEYSEDSVYTELVRRSASRSGPSSDSRCSTSSAPTRCWRPTCSANTCRAWSSYPTCNPRASWRLTC